MNDQEQLKSPDEQLQFWIRLCDTQRENIHKAFAIPMNLIDRHYELHYICRHAFDSFRVPNRAAEANSNKIEKCKQQWMFDMLSSSFYMIEHAVDNAPPGSTMVANIAQS